MKAGIFGTVLTVALLAAATSVAVAQGTHTSAAAADSTAAPAATAPATPPPAAAKPPAQKGPSKIYYGGTASFGFGSTSSIGIWPMVGYKFTPRLSGGVEAGYEYVSYGNDQSTHNYGGSVFSRLRVGRSLYGMAEYQSMNYEIFSGLTSTREWVPAMLVGGGAIRSLGRASVYVEVLFDVLQDTRSPYGDWEPIITFGAAVGF